MANLNNTFNFIKKLTIPRLANMLLVYVSYKLSITFNKPIQWGLPFSVAIEPTTSCNLRCPECPSGLRSFTRPIGMLESKFFKKAIDDFSKKALYLTFYFQGEPYLNPKFLEMAKYANSKNMYTATSTNAHYLNDANAKATIESGLDRLIISLDGTTQETYQQYRIGGRIEKVLDGARNMVKWKKQMNSATPHLIFQFLVVRPNEHQIDDLHKLAKEIGVDEVILKTAQVYDYKNGNDLIPENEKYSRYNKHDDGTYSIKNELKNNCWKLWHSCVVTWDGKVVPCCFDKDADYVMGDLSTHSVKEIWNDKGYKDFRKKIVFSRKEIDICTNCSEGCEVNFNYEL